MVQHIGFEYLFDDYNKSIEQDKYKLEMSFESFKLFVMFAIILIITFAWPYFALLTARKYFK